MLRLLLIGVGVLLASWVVLVVLATRLPEGTLKELASFLPDCVTTVRRLRKHPDVPRRAKLAIGFAGLWVISPIDLIPEFLPVIGPLDDVVVVALALRYAARKVPRDVLFDAWPGKPAVMERLLGDKRRSEPRVSRTSASQSDLGEVNDGDRADDEAVDPERGEGAAFEVAAQELDGEIRRDTGDDATDQDLTVNVSTTGTGEGRQLENAGGEDDRGGEQEREVGGVFMVETTDQSSDEGDTRA